MNGKEIRRKKRHGSIRKRITGSAERPRLCVRRSLKNLYVQVVDDSKSRTVYAFSTQHKEFLSVKPEAGKIAAATKLGELYAPKLKEKGITKISFDRGGYKYHGRVKALADSLRSGGIEF